MMAYVAGHREVTQALLDAGPDVNAKDDNGDTLLIRAMYQDDCGMVKALLNKGADANARTSRGCPALVWACEERNIEGRKDASRQRG